MTKDIGRRKERRDVQLLSPEGHIGTDPKLIGHFLKPASLGTVTHDPEA